MLFQHRLFGLLISLAAVGVAQAADDDRDGVARLVGQLGHDKYAQREAAARALERIGIPALTELRSAAATSHDAELKQRAAALVFRIENGLDQLLADYRTYGLPLPPEKAPLVRFKLYSGDTTFIIDDNGKQKAITSASRFALGFLIEPATKKSKAKLLRGTQTWRVPAEDVGAVIDIKSLQAKDFDEGQWEASMGDGWLTTGRFGKPFVALVDALQMHARGWSEAGDVFEKGFRDDSSYVPQTAVRLLAWEYWNGRLLDSATDHWPAACKQLKTIRAAELELNTLENRRFLKSLEAALVPSKSKSGSIESLIDELINVRVSPREYESNDRLARILDLGFEAVPALLEHLHDDRLTRYRKWSEVLNDSSRPDYHYRVSDMASSLLQAIAGTDASCEWPNDRNDRSAEKALAEVWWKGARKQGEETYFVANVLPPLPVADSPGNEFAAQKDEWPVESHVRLLGKKYPHRLVQIYRDVLENRPRMQTSAIVEALSASSLAEKDKAALFILAARNKSFKHRYAALLELKKREAEQFVTLLVATLDELPCTPVDCYSRCIEAKFAYQVYSTDDRRAWQALERAARRVDVGLRMQVLGNINYLQSTATQRPLRLAFLAAFLDDDSLRDIATNPKMFNGIYAGYPFPRLEVRNFAAMQILSLVGTRADFNVEWTAAKWATFRERMREVAKRELDGKAKK